MATLTLTVLRSPDAGQAEQRQLHGGELTIGRGADCDWTLADPLKSLSRKHCTLSFLAGAWQVQDLSVNGTFVNYATAAIGRGAVQPLNSGDRLRLGDYEIEAHISGVGRPVDDTVGLGGAAPAPFGGAAPLPFGSAAPLPFGAAPSPFGAAPSPFGADPQPFGAAPSPFGAAAPSPFGEAPLPFGAAAPGPGGVAAFGAAANPFGDPVAPFGGEPHPGGSGLPFGDAAPRAAGGFGGARLPGLDDAGASPFGAEPRHSGAIADHAPAASDAFVPPPYVPAVKQLVPDDWFHAPGPAAPAAGQPIAARMAPPAPAEAHLGSSQGYGPTVQAPPSARPAMQFAVGHAGTEGVTALSPPPAAPVTAPPAPAPTPAAAGGTGMTAALAALMAGGELPPELVGRAAADPATALRNAGALLHGAVAGIRALLIARGSVKREFRIEQTMLRVKENNPMKFAMSDEQALAAMLDPRIDAIGFLRESITDLTLHQVAVLAATQAAARSLLQQLEPAKLIAADPGGGLLPGAQEKRLWEAYKRRHAKLLEEFEDDFESAFGVAFARAYEQAVDRDKGLN